MTKLKFLLLLIIIGEGASGGALGIGVGDKILMLNNAWYSVISLQKIAQQFYGEIGIIKKQLQSL